MGKKESNPGPPEGAIKPPPPPSPPPKRMTVLVPESEKSKLRQYRIWTEFD